MIADDEPLVRELLVATFRASGEFEVVAVAGSADEATALARHHRPDVALVDVHMPGGGPLATRSILECSPQTRVIALSASEDDAAALAMVEAGAVSYVLKSSSPNDLVDAILRSARGERVLAAAVSTGVLAGLTSRIAATSRAERERQRVADQVVRVLRERSLETVFQPIVELATGTVVGFEALTRFTAEPRRSPDLWFADAAAAGVEVELELLAARTALEGFRSGGLAGFLSLNVSPASLAAISELLRPVAGLELVVEVTEHAPIADYAPVLEVVADLRAQGMRVAVDDAGAGFASLRHTLQLTPDLVKLDVSLTHGIDQDERRRALAAGLLGFARELGAQVVAEGIEEPGELETLRALGVAYGQGYLLGRPEPVRRSATDVAQ